MVFYCMSYSAMCWRVGGNVFICVDCRALRLSCSRRRKKRRRRRRDLSFVSLWNRVRCKEEYQKYSAYVAIAMGIMYERSSDGDDDRRQEQRFSCWENRRWHVVLRLRLFLRCPFLHYKSHAFVQMKNDAPCRCLLLYAGHFFVSVPLSLSLAL